MKLTMLTVCVLFAFTPAWAQDPIEEPHGLPPELGESELGPPPALEPSLGEQPDAPFLDRWLNHLKEKDTEEYARLQKLRETNPEEFRQALHEKLMQEKMRFYSRRGPHGRPPMNPEIIRLEQEVMDISKTCREATDDGQKEQIRKNLRQKLEVLFDLRETERQQHIRRIEADLINLKKSVDERQSKREQIIDQRLQQLTDGDGLRW